MWTRWMEEYAVKCQRDLFLDYDTFLTINKNQYI